MRPELWPEVESTLASALELPEAERLPFVERSCADEEVRAEVESLLAVYERAQGFLTTPEPPGAGRRFGPYKITGEICRGGMGVVFLAERDDDQFQKRVAIKIVAAGAHDPESLRRFRSERQILASLEHPNIARLLDSGVADDGLPFIIMEYVVGTPITEFCRALPLEKRLSLFHEVCLAVHFAHQHLVVHRDIKPGNILVSSEGVAKLLDFGIAKIIAPLEADRAPDSTAISLQPLTPDYASPEQLRGGAVSTASDLYSLGVLLFELLTEKRPYRFSGKTLEEAAQIASSDRPLSAEGVPVDLLHIVRKAMRAKPEERYASANELAADIERYLTGRPVLARRGGFRYIARKFVARHRAAVAAAAIVALVLLAGAAALIHASRVAEAERAKAQQRFDQVRQLANSLVFEIHDGIATLPGSTPVRKTLVARALQYLDSLEKASSGDIGLEMELAQTYRRLGTVQGLGTDSNLGDPQGALASFGRGIEILQRVLAAAPGRFDALDQLGWLHLYRGNVYLIQRDSPKRDEEYNRARGIFEQLAARFPNDERVIKSRAAVLFRLADARAEKDPEAGVRLYVQSLAMYERLLQAHPENAENRRNVALVHKYIANLIKSKAEALDHLQKALALDENRVAAQPNDAAAKLDVSFDLSDIGWRLERGGDFSGALENYQRVLAIRQELAGPDPSNAQLRSRLIYAHKRVAGALTKMGRLDAAVVEYGAAIKLAEAAVAAGHNDRWVRVYLGELNLGMAGAEAQLASHSPASRAASEHHRKSCQAYLSASRILGKLVEEGGSTADERTEAKTAAQATDKWCEVKITALR
jgi:non-specific serine/threonine protein kinase/serine/threonine-protein kinase